MDSGLGNAVDLGKLFGGAAATASQPAISRGNLLVEVIRVFVSRGDLESQCGLRMPRRRETGLDAGDEMKAVVREVLGWLIRGGRQLVPELGDCVSARCRLSLKLATHLFRSTGGVKARLPPT